MKEIGSTHPAVSIIVPCYNVGPYLDACLNSLLNQTLRNIEIICVNDGSTDDTLQRLRDWEGKDARIRVFDQMNTGVSGARNAGLQAVSGTYVGFADPDDILLPDMFSCLFDLAEQYGADVAECGYEAFLDADGSVLEELSYTPETAWHPDEAPERFCRHSVWGLMMGSVWNKLFRRGLLEDASLRFIPEVSQGEDVAFLLMAVPLVRRIVSVSDRLYRYRQSRPSASTCGRVAYMHDFRMDLISMDRVVRFWRDHGAGTPEVLSGLVDYYMEYLRRHFIVPDAPFNTGTESQRQALLEGWRLWLEFVGHEECFRNLDHWFRKYSELLRRPPSTFLRGRLWHSCLMSRCRGRRGAYYAIKRELLRLQLARLRNLA